MWEKRAKGKLLGRKDRWSVKENVEEKMRGARPISKMSLHSACAFYFI